MLKYILPLALSLSCFSQTINEKHQLLWEISGKGMKQKSFLFGSLHSNEKELFHLTDSTYYALDQATTVVLEADIFSIFDEYNTRQDYVEMNYDNEGNPYGNSYNASTTAYGDEDGMPQFLDAYFQQYCYNAGKTFAALESVDSQVELLSNMNRSRYGYNAYSTSDELIKLYLKGDIYSIDEYLRSSMSIYPKGYERVIVERNFGMATKIDSLLKINGNKLFCAVGAGHLAGPSGLINLLKSKGYKVRRVVASYSEDPTVAISNVRKFKSYAYKNDEFRLGAEFPGKPIVIRNEDEGYLLKLMYSDLGQGNSYVVELYPLNEDIGLLQLAERHIGTPSESPLKQIKLDNGGEAYQGLADTYAEGFYWVRVVMSEDYFGIIKAYGGNKFMNSNRAERFFNKVWID